MKQILLTTVFAAFAANIGLAEGFTITADIPGLSQGRNVKLVSLGGRKNDLAQAVTINGSFTLKGNVSSPTLCEIRIEGATNEDKSNALSLMVENLDMKVTAPHIDSIPPGFYVGTPGLEKSRYVKVAGGLAQKELDEYNSYMYPYNYAAKKAHYNAYWDENRDRSKEGKARLQKELSKASIAEAKAEKEFINAHPDYVISGIKIIGMLDSPFGYSNEELDAMKKSVAGMWDKDMLRRVEERIEKSREYPRLAPYTDFTVLDTDGKECSLSSKLDPNKYTLVDFWASWCGPCRMAIPHVKELANKYDGKLDVISVSLDSDEQAWRKAMEAEKMPWIQLWADKPHVEAVSKPYNITGIPFIMLISPDGKIAFGGHDPDTLSEFLSTTL